jgi:hypothetical protein
MDPGDPERHSSRVLPDEPISLVANQLPADADNFPARIRPCENFFVRRGMKFAKRNSQAKPVCSLKRPRGKVVQRHGSERLAAIQSMRPTLANRRQVQRKRNRHRNVGGSPCLRAHWSRCRPKAAMKLNNSSPAQRSLFGFLREQRRRQAARFPDRDGYLNDR